MFLASLEVTSVRIFWVYGEGTLCRVDLESGSWRAFHDPVMASTWEGPGRLGLYLSCPSGTRAKHCNIQSIQHCCLIKLLHFLNTSESFFSLFQHLNSINIAQITWSVLEIWFRFKVMFSWRLSPCQFISYSLGDMSNSFGEFLSPSYSCGWKTFHLKWLPPRAPPMWQLYHIVYF